MVKTDEDETVGVGRIHSNTPDEWQIRYMAVDEEYRRRGIASKILQHLEDYARSKGARRISLNAREAAVNFYIHHEYQIIGDAYTLFDVIKHKSMQKIL